MCITANLYCTYTCIRMVILYVFVGFLAYNGQWCGLIDAQMWIKSLCLLPTLYSRSWPYACITKCAINYTAYVVIYA